MFWGFRYMGENSALRVRRHRLREAGRRGEEFTKVPPVTREEKLDVLAWAEGVWERQEASQARWEASKR